MNKVPIEHDRQLFAALFDLARRLDRSVRAGAMFGCPAAFHGRKMAACVYGRAIALKIPEELAKTAIDTGRAVPFTPYGRARMREWIMVSPAGDGVEKFSGLLAAALAYARAKNAEAS